MVESAFAPAAVVTPAPVKAAPLAQPASKPVTAPMQQAVNLQAEVFDLEALIGAVASGQVPITVLSVNWDALDAIVSAKGNSFSAPGVRLVKVAA
ncbi:hypothetical protein D3C87_1825020 [compost metagenome]